MTMTHPFTPDPVLELRGARAPGPPVPPLAAVLVDLDDDRAELMVTIDGDGLLTACLAAGGISANGSGPALLDYVDERVATVIASVTLVGHDLDRNRFVTAPTAVALRWIDHDGMLSTSGSATLTDLHELGTVRFTAVDRHPVNRHPPPRSPFAPFPCHHALHR